MTQTPEQIAAGLVAENARLREALGEIVGPLNVCSDNPNVPDDTLIPVDITMGEIRKARAALGAEP